MDEQTRKRHNDALALGRQKSEAADALWSNGLAAEGLHLAADALDATLAAIPIYSAGMKLSATPVPLASGTEAASPDAISSDPESLTTIENEIESPSAE